MRLLLARIRAELHRPGARRMRPVAAGVLSLLFLLALGTFLIRRARVPTRPVRAVERPSLEPQNDARPGRYYTVRPDDTLESLARRFYRDPGGWRAIARANDIRDPRTLQIGALLWIPELEE